MPETFPFRIIRFFPVILLLVLSSIQAHADDESHQIPEHFFEIIKVLGVMGEMHKDVLVVQYPRDLRLSMDKEVPSALIGTSWVSWKIRGKLAIMTGNFLLFENELDPFVLQLEKGNLKVAALHNFFPGRIFPHKMPAYRRNRQSRGHGKNTSART